MIKDYQDQIQKLYKEAYKAAANDAASDAKNLDLLLMLKRSSQEQANNEEQSQTIRNTLNTYHNGPGQQKFLEKLNETANDITRLVRDEPENILSFADEIIILNNEYKYTDPSIQFACWVIMNSAAGIEYNKYIASNDIKKLASLGKYRVAAKAMFTTLIEQLPVEMQPLKVLYTMGEYKLVDQILKEYFKVSNDRNENELKILLLALNILCGDHCRASAKKTFEIMIKDYSNLPEQHRAALEEQRAFVIMLRSYAYFAGDDDTASSELRVKIRLDSSLIDQNVKDVLAQRATIEDAIGDYNRIKQELTQIDAKQRLNDRNKKTIDGIKAVFSYPLSGTTVSKTDQQAKSALSNMGKATVAASLAAVGYYLGIDAILSVVTTFARTATTGAGAVPVAAFIKADIETQRERFPELEEKLKLLERLDLNKVDSVFLSKMDEAMGYDPVNRTFAEHKNLTVTNDNLFNDMYNHILVKAENYIEARKTDIERIANETILKDINITRTLIEDVLTAAGKTLTGLIFVTAGVLLTFLLAVGLTGPVILFAMSPALSIGLVGAAVVAGLKYMYPDPKLSTKGFLVDTAVKCIFAPISFILAGAEILTRPFMALYNSSRFQIYKLEKTLKVMDLSGKESSECFAVINQIYPNAVPSLIGLLKSEQQRINNSIAAAAAGDTAIDLKNVACDLANLEIWWRRFESLGNDPREFCINLELFLQDHYKIARASYESAAIERNSVANQPYVPVRQPLCFSKRPDFNMKNIVEYPKEQKDIHGLQDLKQRTKQVLSRLQ